MKIIKTANGNEIKLSKSEWQNIGKTAGWITASSPDVERALSEINSLVDDEKSYLQHSGSIPDMEEATPEDYDAGYGRGMPGEDFVLGLQHFWVDVLLDSREYGEFKVVFNGNNSPSSVNAGRPMIFHVGVLNESEARDLVSKLRGEGNIDVYVGENAAKILGVEEQGKPVANEEEPEGDGYDGDGMSDAEADADTLQGAGYGTDEDYGHFGV